MTPIDRFERQLPAALADLGDERTPDYLIDILGRTARTRQRPAWVSPGRWIDMSGSPSRPALAALLTAIVVVAIGGVIWITRPNTDQPAVVGGPTPAPVVSAAPTSASPSATATPTEVATSVVPEALRYTWVSAPRQVAGLSARQRFRFTLRSSSLGFPNDLLTGGDLGSYALLAGDQLEFRLLDAGSGCAAGDDGSYRYVLSAGGTRLHLEPAGTDPCTTRSLALSGDWIRVGCKNLQDACFGDLEAATYPSQYVDFRTAPGKSWEPDYGALTYTVPDGWANFGDYPFLFGLTPSVDYALEDAGGPPAGTTHSITLYARPAAVKDCAGTVDSSAAKTVGGLLGAITRRPGVVVGASGSVTVGPLSGRWSEISVSDAWKVRCPGDTVPVVVLATSLPTGSGETPATVGIARGERMRVIALDLGHGDLALIVIDSTYPDRFDQLVSQAMPIIQSFTFK